MIKVQVLKKSERFDFDYLTELSDLMADGLKDALKKDLEDSLSDFKCDIHKSNTKGTIIVNLDKSNNNHEFKDFCCSDFEHKIKTELTKK